MKQTEKAALAVLLTLCVMLGLIPGLTRTAWAQLTLCGVAWAASHAAMRTVHATGRCAAKPKRRMALAPPCA